VDDAQDLDAVFSGEINDQAILESSNPKDACANKCSALEFGTAAHFWLGREKGKGFVGGHQEAAAQRWAAFGNVVHSLIVEILVRFGRIRYRRLTESWSEASRPNDRAFLPSSQDRLEMARPS